MVEQTPARQSSGRRTARISEASTLVAAILDYQWVLDLVTLNQHSLLETVALDELRACSLRANPMTIVVLGVVPGKLNERVAAVTRGDWHVIELDPLVQQLERSRRKLLRSRVSPRARFAPVGGLAEAIPLRSESMDTVLSFFLLHELPAAHRDLVVGEASRVLKPGGSLILVDFANAASWRGRLLLGMFAAMGQQHLRSFVGGPILRPQHERLRTVRQEFFCDHTFQFLVAEKFA